jgi:Outer membrane protein beta-barrel domain
MISKNASAWRRGSALAALAVACLAASVPAAAVEEGIYIALDYNSNKFDRTAADFDAELQPFLACGFASDLSCTTPANVSFAQTSLDNKSKGYDLWVGYQFSPWLAVEGAYLDMGRTHHSFNGTVDVGPVDVDGDGVADYDGPQPLSGRTTFHTRGPAMAVVGTVGLGEYFSAEARAGLFFADNKLSLGMQYTPPPGPQPYSYSESDSKTALFYGASATFWVTPYVGVRGGFATYRKGAFDRDIKQFFLGVRYSYGY